MLNLITGTPGSGKTLYAVFLIDKYEIANKLALDYNAKVYKENLELIEKQDLKHYFFSYTYFCKILKNYVTETFDDSYFGYLADKVRTRNIFLDVKFYNGIIDNIRKDLGLELKSLKFVRHIFANIDGLKVDNVNPIEIDWRNCPDGSIVFYDEIQLIPEYSCDNKKDELGIIKMLTVHRHRAFDIYGITQFPRLVHTGFRDVVGLHYHLHRGWGAPSATVYVWANCREKPNSLGNKFTAERDFRFNYPKRLYEVYESATADTVKLRVPLKLFAILIIPFIGLLMLGNMFFSNGHTFLGTIFGSDKQQVKQQPQQQQQQKPQQQKQTQTNEQISAASSPVANQFQDDASIAYDPSHPYKDFTSDMSYQPTSKPVFAGCIKYNNKYYAYTQQGTKLNVSQSDCKKLIEDGDRPFNYFQAQQTQNQLQQTHNQTQEVSNVDQSKTNSL